MSARVVCSPSSIESVQVAMFAELLSQSGEAVVRVNGSSMLPAIWPGDVLTVRRCGLADMQPGDVAVFTRDGRLFAHRVQAVSASHLITQGDSVPSIDPPVQGHELLGKADAVVRAGARAHVSRVPSRAARLVSGLVARSSRVSRLLQRGHRLQQRMVAA